MVCWHKTQHSNHDFKYDPYNYYQCKFSAQLLEVAKEKNDTTLWFTYLEENYIFFLKNSIGRKICIWVCAIS